MAASESSSLLSLHPFKLQELGHIFYPMDLPLNAAVIIEDGRIHWTPIPLLEATALCGRPGNIVFLNSHNIGCPRR
jgi:hypothetical protein